MANADAIDRFGMSAQRDRRDLSERHKAALAEGREQGRVVRRYLETLAAQRAHPGPRRSPESLRRRITQIDRQLLSADPLRQLHLVQERLVLDQELGLHTTGAELAAIEAAFVEAAAAYSRRKGISYVAWREVGVPAAVLRRAGIRRGASRR